MPKALLNSETAQSAIKALLYFDIFEYPMTATEVYKFLGTNHTTREEVEEVLVELVYDKVIYQYDGYYFLKNDATLVDRRKKGNQEAEKWTPLAQRNARLIQSFPFVRAVFASGSFSKNYMDADSDLDFFIVTTPGRLWIARMLLVLYKRVVLLNSHKTFCINYFIDQHHLEIEEKNIYTAVELVTLLPLATSSPCSMIEENLWVKNLFPNFDSLNHSTTLVKPGIPKLIIERVLSWVGDPLDTWFMNISYRRWKRIHSEGYNKSDFDIAFKTRRFVSKNHSKFYQKKVLTSYDEKLRSFSSKFSFQWIHE